VLNKPGIAVSIEICMRKFFFILLLFPSLVCAQNPLVDDFTQKNIESKKRVFEYISKTGIAKRQAFSNGKVIELVDIDPLGHPVYNTTYNAEAAFTTSTNGLYSGGNLGLNISGNGMIVGVWDEGSVMGNHVELVGKSTPKDGAVNGLSSHSTHVTATIAGKGINPNARGMANKATVYNYDWNSVDIELLTEGQNGLIISNHSWGNITGWDYNPKTKAWTWYGTPSVSNVEDYKFGLYMSGSYSWDQISYSNPNFLIIKAAGNDRGDGGDGAHPQDGPFDSIEPLGVAKNILTVGAVNSLSNKYSGPLSVIMAGFSSWGPTDDGRIKPDLVGAGVNIFSAWTPDINSYATISGTSMATPNVTGSLVLLQELYSKLHSTNLKSATLKALAIETTEETGDFDGPDYQFGWGLLNVDRAARLLLAENGAEFQVIETRLVSGSTYQKQINVKQGQKVNVTICWTDPPGPAETRAILDPPDLRLVNDLDMRITNGPSKTYFPWAVNPTTLLASKVDNFRDNVERIEFVADADGTYLLTIGHKGQLQTGAQNVSLVISIGDIDSQIPVLYFRGVSSNWSDPQNWSSTPGGPSAARIPTAKDVVIFDSNSTSGTVQLSSNSSCYGLSFLNAKTLIFDLKHFDLTLGGSLISENLNLIVKNGTMNFINDVRSGFIDCLDNFQSIAFEFAGTGTFSISSDLKIDSLRVLSGSLYSKGRTLQIPVIEYSSVNQKTVDFSKSTLTGLQSMSQVGPNLNLISKNTNLIFSGTTGILDVVGSFTNVTFGTDNSYVKKEIQATKLSVTGNVTLSAGIQVDSLLINKAKSIMFAGSIVLTVNDQFDINPLTTGITKISAVVSSGNASIIGTKNKKICLPPLTIENVNAFGLYKFVVATTSSLTNSTGWITDDCTNVLFADFNYLYPCTSGATQFIDKSDGNPTGRTWDFGDGQTATGSSTEYHTFTAPGTYVIKLTVTKGVEIHTSTKQIIITNSDLNKPQVVVKEGNLWSTTFSDGYQWYINGNPIINANSYILTDFSASGSYVIDIFNSTCRKRSDPFIVAGVPEENSNLISVYPIPTSNMLHIKSYLQIIETVIVDAVGRSSVINLEKIDENQYRVDVSSIPTGVYILKIMTNSTTDLKKFVILK